jgi:NAD(P)-dependent dehydrogenase (short-subunit alcohol dehydrogenase family)
VVSLTLPLARDLAAIAVRVNTIAPGLFDTPIYGSGEVAEAKKQQLGESVVFPRRLGTAAEFADLALSLITNSYMNGEVVRIDGAIRLPPKSYLKK